MRWIKNTIRWLLMIVVSVFVSACGLLEKRPAPPVEFCGFALQPFEWASIEEMEATPDRPFDWIEWYGERHASLCPKKRSM